MHATVVNHKEKFWYLIVDCLVNNCRITAKSNSVPTACFQTFL